MGIAGGIWARGDLDGGTSFAADGLQASGFMAGFAFGIVLGNKEAFGFAMEPGESRKLDEYVVTTAFILRVLMFILLGTQVDFNLMSQHWIGGVLVVMVLMLVARPQPFSRAPRRI